MRSEGFTVVGRANSCLSVCLSVCYHASEGIARFYAKTKVRTALVAIGLSRFLTRKNLPFKSYGVKKPIC